LRNYKICKSSNISPMKAYERHMHRCVGWLWWHKVLQKFKWFSFGIGS
jgi:hypothetical protein